MSVRVPIGSSHPAAHLAQAFEEELRKRIAVLRCPEHDEPALAELSIADDGAVHIAPVGCCDLLKGLVLATLREFSTLTPPSDLDLPRPGEPC